MAVQFFLVLIWMNFSEQALQMLKEHPTYKDDDEIQGSKTWFFWLRCAIFNTGATEI